MRGSKFWELLQDPDFKIWNIGIDYRNEEAKALKKTVAPFDIVMRINDEPVNNLQECNISLVNIEEDVGVRFNLVFHVPNPEIPVSPMQFIKYVFNIDLQSKGLPIITLVEKTKLK